MGLSAKGWTNGRYVRRAHDALDRSIPLTRSYQIRLDQKIPDQIRSDQAGLDQIRPIKARLDQIRPDYTRSDQIRPDLGEGH